MECLHLVCVIVYSFQRCLQEVGYLRCLAGLAPLGDRRGSCLCSTLIPSVAERSTLFVKELSFPQTAPTDDAFFNQNWAGACWNRLAGTGTVAGPEPEPPLGWSIGSGRWTPLQKQERKRINGGSSVAALMPKSVLSLEENINCLEDGCSAYL